MELLEECFKPWVNEVGVEELGNLWSETNFVLCIDVYKRILKNAMRKKKKEEPSMFEQLHLRDEEIPEQTLRLPVYLTLLMRRSCSDLRVERSCQRAMLCFRQHRPRAWKKNKAWNWIQGTYFGACSSPCRRNREKPIKTEATLTGRVTQQPDRVGDVPAHGRGGWN